MDTKPLTEVVNEVLVGQLIRNPRTIDDGMWCRMEKDTAYLITGVVHGRLAELDGINLTQGKNKLLGIRYLEYFYRIATTELTPEENANLEKYRQEKKVN